MTNLDDYLSTPDEYFNQEAQFWYFYWIGEKKINSNKPVEVFMRALYDGYFFILEYYKKPFTCVEKLKEISQQSGFTLDENKVYITKIEDIVQRSKKRKEMILTFLQIMAYHQEIEPLDPKEFEPTEEEIKEFLPFEFEDIKAEFQTLSDLAKRHKYLTNLLFDFEYKEKVSDSVFVEHYEEIGLKQWINTELHRCEYEQMLEAQTSKSIAKPAFQLSDKKGAKTDLIRVLNALYELKLIDKADGQTPTKQEFMKSVGEYFGVDLSKYHTNLSQALQNQPLEVNLKVFEDMKKVTQNAAYQPKIK